MIPKSFGRTPGWVHLALLFLRPSQCRKGRGALASLPSPRARDVHSWLGTSSAAQARGGGSLEVQGITGEGKEL